MRPVIGLVLGLGLATFTACASEVGALSDPDEVPELELVLPSEPVPAGSSVAVRLRNNGTRTFRYNTTGYEACNLRYRDATGRRFIIPEGTHCDTISMGDVGPGDTVTLFTWELTECLEDNWGCAKDAPLPEGTYTMRGSFEATTGAPARVHGTVTIGPPGPG